MKPNSAVMEYINKISAKIILVSEGFTLSKNWKLKIMLSSVILSLFFAFPSYDVFLSGEFNENWNNLFSQIDHPLRPLNLAASSHGAKLAFRLTVPIIAKLLNLNIVGLFFIQFIALITMFFCVISLSEAITKDRVTSAFISFGFALIFPGNVLVSDLRGIFDSVSYCLVILTMCLNSVFLIFFSTLLAAYADERAFIVTGFIFAWFILKEINLKEENTFKPIKINARAAAVFAAWIVYFTLRFALLHFFGLRTTSQGCRQFLAQINGLCISIWTGLEGFWIIVAVSLFLLFVFKKYLFLFIYCLLMFISIFVAGSVFDVTRSMGYLIPAIFISLYIIKQYESVEFVRKLALLSLIVCFFPTYYIGGKNTVSMFYPLPLQLFRMFFLKG